MKRRIVAVGVALVVALLLWGVLHVFISQINPDQRTPPGHFGQPCWVCHILNSSARIIDE